MIFERLEVKDLAHYSYIVGCESAKKVAVVDPKRDVDDYLDFAARHGLTITHVLETHIHADYASGAPELAARTGAAHCVSGKDAGENFEARYRHRDLFDGDAIEIGSVRIQTLYTPGHTPEHIAFLVYDAAVSATEPTLMLSGDFLFIGSLGRPDLLGEDAKRALAVELYESVTKRIADLPDDLAVHPAHGAGSMCGAGMCDRPSSTLGAERTANPYFDKGLTKTAFVDKILSTVPPFPPYYRRMKRLNSDGAPNIDDLPAIEALDAAAFRERADAGHVVIDLRNQLEFGARHVPNSFGIGAAGALSTWAAWVVPYDTPILLVAPDPTDVDRAARCLRRVGLDLVRGHLDGGFDAWLAAGHPTTTTPQISPADLNRRLEGGENICLIDVRGDGEWAAGHVNGAMHIMGGFLADRIGEIPRDGRPIATLCGGGYRSTVAAAVLERAGMLGVINVTGGMAAWTRAGLPLTTT